jgi:hypothetical protein
MRGMRVARLPKRAAERDAAGPKRFQPILAALKARDVGEVATVLFASDLLPDVYVTLYETHERVVSSAMSTTGPSSVTAIKTDGCLL